MTKNFENDIELLALVRVDVEAYKAEMKAMVEEVTESEAYKKLQGHLIEAQAKAEQLEGDIRGNATMDFMSTDNKHPHPAVTVKAFSVIKYEAEKALSWAKDNLPAAVKLDNRLFEKHAKAVSATAPLSFVTFEDVYKAEIATDLSGYIKSPKEDEIPF